MTRWWRKQRYLLDYALAGLGRRRGRVVGLVGTYALVAFVVAVILFSSAALRGLADRALADAPEILVQGQRAGRHVPLPGAAAGLVAGLRGVRGVTPRLWGYARDEYAGATFTLAVPTADPPPDGEVDLGAPVAARYGVGPGGTFTLISPRGTTLLARVRRVLPPADDPWTRDLIRVSEAEYRDFVESPAAVFTDLAVRVRNPREVDTVGGKILRALPGSRLLTRDDLRDAYRRALDWREGFLLTPLLAVLGAFGLLVFERASGLSAEERREIGVLKGIGWSSRDVLRMKAWEGAAVSLTACLLGWVAADAYAFGAGAPVVMRVLAGWSAPALAGPLPRVPVAGLGLSFFALGVLPYVAATMVPVWRAATLDPDEVMR